MPGDVNISLGPGPLQHFWRLISVKRGRQLFWNTESRDFQLKGAKWEKNVLKK